MKISLCEEKYPFGKNEHVKSTPSSDQLHTNTSDVD